MRRVRLIDMLYLIALAGWLAVGLGWRPFNIAPLVAWLVPTLIAVAVYRLELEDRK